MVPHLFARRTPRWPNVNLYSSTTNKLGSIISNTNESQVAPVLKSRFENLELESIRRSQLMNKALFRFAGILKASPLKDTTSDHRNTQEHLSREQQILWETDGRFGVSCQCRGGLVDWIGA